AAVLHDDLLAEALAQGCRDHAADRVVDGAGRERDDEADRPGGVVLRRERRGEGEQQSGAEQPLEQWSLHLCSPSCGVTSRRGNEIGAIPLPGRGAVTV